MSLYEQAAYTDGRLMHVRGVDVLLRRGQMVVSIRSLAALWGWSKSSVDRFLKKMRDEKRDDLRIDINMVSGTAYLIVTVCESYNYEDVPTMCGTVSGGGTATGTEGDAVSGTATGTATGTDEKCASDSIREYCECNDSETGTATGTEGDAVGGTEGDAVSGTYTSYRKKDSKKDKKEKKEIPHTQLLRDFKNACARADTREAAFACFKELLDRGFFDSEESAMLPRRIQTACMALALLSGAPAQVRCAADCMAGPEDYRRLRRPGQGHQPGDRADGEHKGHRNKIQLFLFHASPMVKVGFCEERTGSAKQN